MTIKSVLTMFLRFLSPFHFKGMQKHFKDVTLMSFELQEDNKYRCTASVLPDLLLHGDYYNYKYSTNQIRKCFGDWVTSVSKFLFLTPLIESRTGKVSVILIDNCQTFTQDGVIYLKADVTISKDIAKHINSIDDITFMFDWESEVKDECIYIENLYLRHYSIQYKD